MEVLNISRKLLNKAREEAERRMQFGFRALHPVSDEYKFAKIYISCIGELVVQEFLNENKASYQFVDNNFPGREIIINDKIVEIRTSGYNKSFSTLNLIYNDVQYIESMNKGISYVVQVFINGYNYYDKSFDDNLCSSGTIAGFIDFSDISNYSIVQNTNRPNYKIGLNDLKDIRRIIDKI